MSGLANRFCYAKERTFFDNYGVTKYSARPFERPSLSLNFLENPTVNDHGVSITCSRSTTTATYFDRNGTLQSAAANTPRFNYNPETGACLGLMAEAGVTNLMLRSRDCTQAAWATVTTLTAALDQVGIDGVANSASSLLADGANSSIYQPITSASAARVFTAYVKRLVGTGTVSISLDGGSTLTDVTSQLVLNKWVRVKATQTLANPSVGFHLATDNDQIAVDYCQCESSTHESSPVLSAASQGVRQPEVLSIATAASWFSQSTGVIYFDGLSSNGAPNGTNQYMIQVDDTTANERHIMYRANSTTVPTAFISDGGVTQITIGTSTWGNNTAAKFAYGYQANLAGSSYNGGTAQADTACTMPTVTSLKLGVSHASSSFWSGHIRRVLIWNSRLANTWLVGLTA